MYLYISHTNNGDEPSDDIRNAADPYYAHDERQRVKTRASAAVWDGKPQ